MRILSKRICEKPTHCISRFYMDGEYICDILEPTWENNARYTAIPKGIYEVIMNYSPKFKRVLPLLLNVPNRSSIRIHRGNYPKDTQGCLLPGENTKVGVVTNSTKYEQLICKLISEAKARKEMVTIQIA